MPDLFDYIPAAQQHSPTSVAAGEAIAGCTGRLRKAVLEAIAAAGAHGLTDEEAQDVIGMPPSTQRPRRVELWRAGLVIDSGTTRPTRSGRKAVVWTCVGAAH